MKLQKFAIQVLSITVPKVKGDDNCETPKAETRPAIKSVGTVDKTISKQQNSMNLISSSLLYLAVASEPFFEVF